MKKIRLLAPLMFATTLMATDPIAPIKNSDQFSSYWKIVEEEQGDKESFQEWIPQGETQELWTKSFGMQKYKLEKGYDLQHFYDLFIETLAGDFESESQELKHEVLEETDDHLLFSWWCEQGDYEIGREWVHLIKRDNNEVVFLRFATKSKDVNAEDDLWREALNLETAQDEAQ